MNRPSIDLDDVRRAAAEIGPHLHCTPLERSSTLSRLAGCEAFLKLELFQKTGSFKPRGAFVNLLRLDAARRARGVITISAGNHAQGVAFAARALDVPATVVMPAAASVSKADAARGYGAEVILHGDVHQAFDKLRELEVERNLSFVHPFDHPHTVIGQGTVGLEIIDALPDPEIVVVPVGGGGLIAGVAVALAQLAPQARIIGVEPEGAAGLVASFAAGRAMSLERVETIADGLGAPFIGELNFALAERHVEQVVTVSDDEIVAGMRFLWTRVKVAAEPAGAAAVAALLAGKLDGVRGRRVVCIVSGGNVDPSLIARLFADASQGTTGGGDTHIPGA